MIHEKQGHFEVEVTDKEACYNAEQDSSYITEGPYMSNNSNRSFQHGLVLTSGLMTDSKTDPDINMSDEERFEGC